MQWLYLIKYYQLIQQSLLTGSRSLDPKENERKASFKQNENKWTKTGMQSVGKNRLSASDIQNVIFSVYAPSQDSKKLPSVFFILSKLIILP